MSKEEAAEADPDADAEEEGKPGGEGRFIHIRSSERGATAPCQRRRRGGRRGTPLIPGSPRAFFWDDIRVNP